MARNSKQTGPAVSKLAARVLQDPNASEIQRRLAGAALAQTHTVKQTGAEMEELAGRVLQSPKYSDETKALAASVVSQANKAR